MPTQKKIDQVAELKELIESSTLIAGTEYRGLRVKEMDGLRRKLREGGIQVRVVKNTLLRLAAQEAGQPDLTQVVEGPTALAYTQGDIIEAAKALSDYAQSAPAVFSLRGAYMEGQVLTADDIKALVKIPPRPVLMSEILGKLQSPLAGFVGLLDAPLREFAGLTNALLTELPGLIEARARQLEASQ